MKSVFLTLVVFAFVACASRGEIQKVVEVESPEAMVLLPMSAYAGEWEMEKCADGGRQAQKLAIEIVSDHMVLKRWQWKKDPVPLFTARIHPESQTLTHYTSSDMRDQNPVMNQASWSWMDSRIVGTLQSLPAKGDLRGNWSAVVMAQYYISKEHPEKLFWTRWGSSHSTKHGRQAWQSQCVYARVQEQHQAPDMKLQRVEKLQTVSSSHK